MARKSVLGMLAGACLAAAASAPVAAETLASALSSAYITSGLLDQNRAVLRAADEDVAQAVAALRPVINWTGTVTRSFGAQNAASTGGMWVDYATTTASADLARELAAAAGEAG